MIDRDSLYEKLKELISEAHDIEDLGIDFLDIDGYIADHLLENDVVKVVRCKDCKHIKYLELVEVFCCRFWNTHRTYENDFCSYGERKD